MPLPDSKARHPSPSRVPLPSTLSADFPPHIAQVFESHLEEGLRQRMGDLLEGVTLEHQKLCVDCGMATGPPSPGPLTPNHQDSISTYTSPPQQSPAGPSSSSGRDEGGGKHKGGQKPASFKGDAKGSSNRGMTNPTSCPADYNFDQEPMSNESIKKVRAFELATIRKIITALSLEHPFYR